MEEPYRLILGDAIEVLKGLEPGSVDAVVTDPPYGIGHWVSTTRANLGECVNYPQIEWDSVPFDPTPILRLDVPTVLWGANHYADRLPPASGWLVWDKERPDTLDQATCELAWTNCVKGVRRFRHLWHGMMRASERGECWHPTQKPVALMRWILGLKWLPNEGTILDPYMGSGPVGVACAEEGFRFIGVEREPKYFAIAEARIKQAFAQKRLFA